MIIFQFWKEILHPSSPSLSNLMTRAADDSKSSIAEHVRDHVVHQELGLAVYEAGSVIYQEIDVINHFGGPVSYQEVHVANQLDGPNDP